MATSSQAIADARSQLSRLDVVIRDLEQAGHAADAEAVRVARKLAERALADDIDAEPPMLLTTRQAGRALGVSIQTIRNWVTAGRLRAERRGTRTMIPREAVLDEIERSRARPSSRGDEVDATTLARRQRLLAGLPSKITAPLDALHDKLERGEPLTPDEERRIVALESEMINAAARTLANDQAPNNGDAAA
jgi:excisionase family DNA binding protein